MTSLTAEHLHAILPSAPAGDIEEELPSILHVMREYQINTKLRFAAFIANVAKESGQLHYVEEIDEGWYLEGRQDLGNIYEGDGPLYKGHGYIQITGRNNHSVVGQALGVDAISDPAVLTRMPYAWLSAGYYWRYMSSWGDLNDYADAGDFESTVLGVRGGEDPDRRWYYDAAMAVLPDDLDLSEGEQTVTEPATERSETVANNVLVYTDDDSYIRARDNDAYVWTLQGSNTPAKADGSGYIYVPGLPGGGSDAAALAPYQADKLLTAADSDTWLRTASGSYIQGEGMSDHDLQANLSGWLWDRTAWEAKAEDDRFWPVADTPPDPNSYSYVDQHPTRYIWVASVEKVARDLVNNFPVWCNTYYGHPPPELVDDVWYDSVSIDVWNPGGRGDWLDTDVHMQVRNHVLNDQNPPWLAWMCSFYEIWEPGTDWRWYSNDTDPATDYAHVYHLHMTFALTSE